MRQRKPRFLLIPKTRCYSFHLTHDSQFAQGPSVHPAQHMFTTRQTLITPILKQTQGEHSMSGLAGQHPVRAGTRSAGRGVQAAF